ncbi:MAG: AAC(3) family N-acetyltransferase [Kiritimatiellia bacterium]
MSNTSLFYTKDGASVSADLMDTALRGIGADQTDILFVHTDLSFGMPNFKLSRSVLCSEILDVILGLGVKTICFPTFTFSFCNGVAYDVRSSKTPMGVLNEAFRKRADVVRSLDPLMSVAVWGQHMEIATKIGTHSCGAGSSFDILRKLSATQRVKFLFFGTRPHLCATYTHYVERCLDVPYRYDRAFTGKVTDINGVSEEKTFWLNVRYQGVKAFKDARLEEAMDSMGMIRSSPVGEAGAYILSEADLFNTTADNIRANANYMLDQPYDGTKETAFFADHMVAL